MSHPIHPGEILFHEFMEPLSLSTSALAQALGVPPNRISQIRMGRRAVTAETAIRLSAQFGTTAEFWMNLQSLYDLEVAREAMGSQPLPKKVAASSKATSHTRSAKRSYR